MKSFKITNNSTTTEYKFPMVAQEGKYFTVAPQETLFFDFEGIDFYTVPQIKEYYEGTLGTVPAYVEATVSADNAYIENNSEIIPFVTPKVAQEGATITVAPEDDHTENFVAIDFYDEDEVEDFYEGVFAGAPDYVAVEAADVFTVTFNVTHGTHDDVKFIREGETIVVKVAADDGYELPVSTDVTVTGAHKNYSKADGTLTLSQATGNVTVTLTVSL